MFKKTSWIIGVIAGLSLIGGLHSADAGYWDYGKYMHIEFTLGGTWLTTRINLYPHPPEGPDDTFADWSTFKISGTLGRYSAEAIAEMVCNGPTTECPGNFCVIDAQKDIGFAIGTYTFPNGDQIYYKISTRTFCDEGEGRWSVYETGVFVGGTGKFAGVSGTFEENATDVTGVHQVWDPTAHQSFGSFTGKGTGILVFPQAQYWDWEGR